MEHIAETERVPLDLSGDGVGDGVVGGRGIRVEQARLFPLPEPWWSSMSSDAAREALMGGDNPPRVTRSRSRGSPPKERDVDEVERVLATCLPASVRDESPPVLAEVMPVVRVWVAAAKPADGVETRRLLWALAPMAVWLRKTMGSLHAGLLTDRNIEVWIHDADKRRTNWQHLAHPLLLQVGRLINPGGCAPPRKTVGRSPIPVPYTAQEETLFGQMAMLPRRGDRAGHLFVAGAGLGAALSGVEIGRAETGHMIDAGGGRLAIRVTGHRGRIVPIRADYTMMVREAAQFADTRGGSESNRFVKAADKNAVSRLTANLDFGTGRLCLRRARNTWIAAHLLAGTPVPDLHHLAGTVSAATIDALVGRAVEDVDPMTAVSRGLRI